MNSNIYFDEGSQAELVRNKKILFLYNQVQYPNNPRDQHFGHLLRYACCHHYLALSVTTLFVLVFLSIFIAGLAIQGIYLSGLFLQMEQTALRRMGANIPNQVKWGRIHLCVGYLFLHSNAISIFFNIIIFLLIMPAFQQTFGRWLPPLLFVLSGFFGGVFTDLFCQGSACNYKMTYGSLIGSYGLMGASFFYMLVNYHSLSSTILCHIGRNALFLLLMSILLNISSSSGADFYCSIWSFFSGLFLGSMFPTINEGNWQKRMRIGGCICLAIMQVVILTVFFTKQVY